MNVKARIARLERRHAEPGCCPECGHRPDSPRFVRIVCTQRGEPAGFVRTWEGQTVAYPPDPRPTCPECGLPDGQILFLHAVYDGAAPAVEPILGEKENKL